MFAFFRTLILGIIKKTCNLLLGKRLIMVRKNWLPIRIHKEGCFSFLLREKKTKPVSMVFSFYRFPGLILLVFTQETQQGLVLQATERSRKVSRCLWVILQISPFFSSSLFPSFIFQMHLKGVAEFILSNLAKADRQDKNGKGKIKE